MGAWKDWHQGMQEGGFSDREIREAEARIKGTPADPNCRAGYAVSAGAQRARMVLDSYGGDERSALLNLLADLAEHCIERRFAPLPAIAVTAQTRAVARRQRP